jgi:hypothetical protein
MKKEIKEITVFIMLSVLIILAESYVFSEVWNWHISKIFGIKLITIKESIPIILLVVMLTRANSNGKKLELQRDFDLITKRTLSKMEFLLFVLTMGYFLS